MNDFLRQAFGFHRGGHGSQDDPTIQPSLPAQQGLPGQAAFSMEPTQTLPLVASASESASASGVRRAPGRPVRTLLDLRGVTVTYGQIAAVRNLNLRVGEGQVVALLGANGAGKTTTLRTISGLLRPRAGQIWFDGRRIDRASAEAVARGGIAHLPEGRGIFPRLTVAENLRMAGYGAGVDKADYDERLQRAVSLFPVLGERMGQLAGTLSGGQQQMLAVGRALVTNPRLLMIDELSFGLAPGVVKQLFAMLPAISSGGTAILLVEQFVGQALAVADYAYVLEKGELTFGGPAFELARREGFVESSYLGSSAVRPDYQRVRPPEMEMLRVRVDPTLIRRMRDVAGIRTLAQVANAALREHVAQLEALSLPTEDGSLVTERLPASDGHGSENGQNAQNGYRSAVRNDREAPETFVAPPGWDDSDNGGEAGEPRIADQDGRADEGGVQ